MLVSAVQQSNLAICINISLSLEPPSHPARSLQSIPELYGSSSLAIYLTHNGVYISLNSSHPIRPPSWVLFHQKQRSVGRDVYSVWGWGAEGKGLNTVHPGLEFSA